MLGFIRLVFFEMWSESLLRTTFWAGYPFFFKQEKGLHVYHVLGISESSHMEAVVVCTDCMSPYFRMYEPYIPFVFRGLYSHTRAHTHPAGGLVGLI